MIAVLIFLLSKFPILSVTSDEEFHNIDYRKAKEITKENYKEKLRFSLLSFGLGAYKVYFITKYKGKFNWIHLYPFEKRVPIPTSEELEKKIKNNRKHISTLTGKSLEIEKEFIHYRIDEEKDRENVSFSKILALKYIILVLLPLLTWVIPDYLSNKFNIVERALLICVVYNLMNVMFWILSFFRIKGYPFSTYNDLKEGGSCEESLFSNFYSDWTLRKAKTHRSVSYNWNIERYFYYFLVYLMLLVLFVSISKFNQNSSIIPSNESSRVMTLEYTDVSVLRKEELNMILEIQNKLINSKVDEVIFFSAKEKKSNKIIELLTPFNYNNANLIFIRDNDLDEKKLKILIK